MSRLSLIIHFRPDRLRPLIAGSKVYIRRSSGRERTGGSGKELLPLIELAEDHVAEAQVVEEIGILWVLAEELLQVDAGLVELAGGEELKCAGEVVGHVAPSESKMIY